MILVSRMLIAVIISFENVQYTTIFDGKYRNTIESLNIVSRLMNEIGSYKGTFGEKGIIKLLQSISSISLDETIISALKETPYEFFETDLLFTPDNNIYITIGEDTETLNKDLKKTPDSAYKIILDVEDKIIEFSVGRFLDDVKPKTCVSIWPFNFNLDNIPFESWFEVRDFLSKNKGNIILNEGEPFPRQFFSCVYKCI